MGRILSLAWLGLAGSLALAQTAAPPGVPQIAPVSPVSTMPAPGPVVSSPAPVAARKLEEKLQNFEPRSVRLAWVNRRWQLLHQGSLLKDFGTREHDARQALRIINDLRLNQYGTIGSPTVMEYWLSNGSAPRTQARAMLRCLPLNPANLRVEMGQGRWWLRDSQRALFGFDQQADAAAALAVIKKYHFDQIALVGHVTPTMHVFTARQSGDAPVLPSTSGSTRQLSTQRFPRLAKNPDGSLRGPIIPQSKTATPFAGMITPALPPISGQTASPPIVINRPVQPTLTTRQVSMWRTKQQPTTTAPANPNQPQRVPFDWRRAQIQQDGSNWKLVCGGLTLANFGPNVNEARLALSAVRHYRFTEKWRTGGEGQVINYCTASGQSPRGLLLGLQAQPLQPEKLEVKKSETGAYALCNGRQVVLQMGQRPDDARRLLEVIQKNKYDRLCQIGEPGKDGLALLVKSR